AGRRRAGGRGRPAGLGVPQRLTAWAGTLGGFGGFGGFAASARGRAAVSAGMLGIALIVPLGLSTAAAQSLVTDVGIYALLALGLNVVVGYAGLLDLGYIAFFAIGAYTTAYCTSRTAMPWHSPVILNPFVVVPIAVVAAMVAGVALGGPTLRLRGDYLAIVTLGFGEIIQLLANNLDGVTGGSRGVFGVPPLSLDVGKFHYAWGLAPLPYYYLLLAIITAVIVVFGRLERSRVGRAWAAIREDEFAAEISGVATVRMKLLAFSIGASVSGFAGVLFATKQFFNPQTFSLQASILVLTIVIFGGMGSRFGVVLGAVVLQGLAFFLRDVVPPTDRYIYFGMIVVIMMIFRPQGLLPPRRRERVGVALPDSDDAGVPGVGGALPVGGQAG
ncbi:branched-chain amino acid ABC transporter permease, partial [Frankia sp. Cj3]|uniref:branched-chain amino acid ABC transporter permease n=2 Tax=unclassified Frankia TaxID=2632575 RepID=UPI001EF64FAE